MVQQATRTVEDLRETIDSWERRLDHLERMARPVDGESRAELAETRRRMGALLGGAHELLDRAGSMGPDEWIDARTQILAALQTLQAQYNRAVADWPRM